MTNGGADARAFATLRRDMANAIARAEQRTFDRLVRGLPTYRKPRREDRSNAPSAQSRTAGSRFTDIIPGPVFIVSLNGKGLLKRSDIIKSATWTVTTTA